MGYELHPGVKWGGDYLVAELISFEDVDCRTPVSGYQVVHVHRTKEVIVDMKDKARFPLRAKCDQTFLEARPPADHTPDWCAPVGGSADPSTMQGGRKPGGLPRASSPGRKEALRRWALSRCRTIPSQSGALVRSGAAMTPGQVRPGDLLRSTINPSEAVALADATNPDLG